MKHLLLTTIAAVVLVGCDPHIDSVYLGRAESKFLGDAGRGDTKTVKAYLDKGGNVNLQDEPGMTPLHHAVNGNWNGANFDTIKLLIDRGANVNAIDDAHHTPLHLCNNKEIAELLIDNGANVNAKTKRTGETPLFSATHGAAQGATKSYQKYLDLAKMLIAKGADVNVKLKTGETTLHVVARQFSEKHASEVCELLIANGAKVNENNSQGLTPVDEALAKQRNKTADLLRKHRAKTAKELKAEGK